MNREQRILEAAEKLFYERSFDGVGVDTIGREAGVTGKVNGTMVIDGTSRFAR